MNERVSVIIPTYKRPVEYLARSIDSVRSQSYENIEIIVIDDSPDSFESRPDIKKYIESLPAGTVRYLQNPTNIGGSLSRNRGMDQATGDFITFLDDDDEYLPGKVERQVKYMQDHDADLSFSSMIMYNSSGKVVDARYHADIPSFDNQALIKYHLMHHMTGTPTFMFRAEKLREIGGFEDVRMGQEFYLMLKAIERGLKIGYINACDVKIYKHRNGGISQGKNKIEGENALYEFKKKYFPLLTSEEIRRIRFRHHAVLFVAYLRNNRIISALSAGLTALLISPCLFVQEATRFIKKIIKYKRSEKDKQYV